MIADYFKYIVLYFIAILLQVFVFDNINLGGYLNPYFYVIFILLLPFDTHKWTLLLLAFTLGFTIDIFNNTFGMHAASSVFMAFLRPFFLKILSPRDGYEKGTHPGMFYYGFIWFAKYSLFLILFHHFLLFTVEVFRFSEFLHTFIRIVASTALTTLIVIVSQLLIFRK